ncbi:hypothetical protein EVAR_36072_1 [Eumeta japonica]|uniref:Uncharacterized protein n=1 Tax=Eumeta variegata TaxID=151549 RepID=A0A4C1YKE6_EUMVA|nr:hypothetical protein EVAR_36072_1 [Eumeta japonica]
MPPSPELFAFIAGFERGDRIKTVTKINLTYPTCLPCSSAEGSLNVYVYGTTVRSSHRSRQAAPEIGLIRSCLRDIFAETINWACSFTERRTDRPIPPRIDLGFHLGAANASHYHRSPSRSAAPIEFGEWRARRRTLNGIWSVLRCKLVPESSCIRPNRLRRDAYCARAVIPLELLMYLLKCNDSDMPICHTEILHIIYTPNPFRARSVTKREINTSEVPSVDNLSRNASHEYANKKILYGPPSPLLDCCISVNSNVQRTDKFNKRPRPQAGSGSGPRTGVRRFMIMKISGSTCVFSVKIWVSLGLISSELNRRQNLNLIHDRNRIGTGTENEIVTDIEIGGCKK